MSGKHTRAQFQNENDFLAAEIRKSGFPLEIEVADALLSHGWEVFPSFYYEDFDDRSHNELDIVASKNFKDSFPGTPFEYTVTVQLLIECKKRAEEVFWVFFPRPFRDNYSLYPDVARMDSFYLAGLCSQGKSSQFRHVPKQIWLNIHEKSYVPSTNAGRLWGLSVTINDFQFLSVGEKSLSFETVMIVPDNKGKSEAGRRERERKEVHAAFHGLAKATTHRKVEIAKLIQELLDSTLQDLLDAPDNTALPFYFWYFFPLLVFDGKLKIWKAHSVSDAACVLHQVTLRSAEYSEDALVPVVTKETFSEWLTKFEDDASVFAKKIAGEKDQLDFLLMDRME